MERTERFVISEHRAVAIGVADDAGYGPTCQEECARQATSGTPGLRACSVGGVTDGGVTLTCTFANVCPWVERARADRLADHPSAGTISGDPTLVVPAPRADAACYAHLAKFLRSAPSAQVSAFWRSVATEALARSKTTTSAVRPMCWAKGATLATLVANAGAGTTAHSKARPSVARVMVGVSQKNAAGVSSASA